MKTIHVAAAVICDGSRIFATQRGYGDWKDYWEFPGGKIEPGETPEEALRREIREELDTEIAVGERLTAIEYDYPEFHLSMECFLAEVREGGLTLKEHEAAKWLHKEELDSVNWLPADRTLIDLLKERFPGSAADDAAEKSGISGKNGRKNRKRVIVGMSGGVDSAVAAYLLKKAGYDVIGVTLRTWIGSGGEESRCCEIDDARESARIIGIPYHVFNCISEFEQKVVNAFIDDYLHGMTPNPCVVCNREIKWAWLLYYANVLQADYVATGHYASVIRLKNGRYTVRKALHAEKDQTYMLYRLTQEQLEKTLMPLGEYSKQEVRRIAEEVGLQIASKPDSQEICFVTDGNYADFIEDHAAGEIPGEGNFVDESGKILGKHKGIIHYTVGQRKGLGIALGHPAYIKKIDADSNEIVLSTAESVLCKEIICKDLNFVSMPEPEAGEAFRCQVKVRYRHSGQYAVIEKAGEDRLRVRFDEPVRFAAPGQSAVFYDDNDCLIGGGVIAEVIFSE